MTGRKLRYSERLALAESGALAPLEFEDVPETFTRAFVHLVQQTAKTPKVGGSFADALQGALIAHFGLPPGIGYEDLILRADVAALLDIVEIVAEESERMRPYRDAQRSSVGGGLTYRKTSRAAMPAFASKFNTLADRHRLGYRLENGEMQRIGSPALSDVVVGPAVLASQRPGWDQVERSFREALRHQRGGSDENDDALTAAAAALEAALKAAGFQGAMLGQLSKAFKGSSLAAPQLRGVPDLLQDLLERSAAVRNIHGDAHGRAPGDHPDVPQELVDLAVHLTGSFVVYLERASR
jgi:hypothetical protein